MRKLLLLIPSFFLSVLVFGQGIAFNSGSWQEILELSKKTNKPIFIDVYATWCGPCKKMDKNIFSLDSVGKEFNTNYICYKVDGEKGDGITIVSKYKVRGYPSFLFIKPDGSIFYRAFGYMDATKFIDISKKALVAYNDPVEWDKEYISKKNDAVFLLAYMKKRARLGLENSTVFSEYLQAIPNSDRTSNSVIELYRKEGANLKISDFAYTNLLENKSIYESAFGSKKVANSILFKGIHNSLILAIRENNEKVMNDIIDINSKLPDSEEKVDNDRIKMIFYVNTNNNEQFIQYALKYGNSILSISKDVIDAKDENNLKSFEKLLRSGKMDTVKLGSHKVAEARKYYSTIEKQKVAGRLNEVAWAIFENISDKSSLEFALKCSKRSIEYFPKNNSYMDTYSNILYRLNRKDEAVKKQEEILNIFPMNSEEYKNAEAVKKKMELGEKTWKK